MRLGSVIWGTEGTPLKLGACGAVYERRRFCAAAGGGRTTKKLIAVAIKRFITKRSYQPPGFPLWDKGPVIGNGKGLGVSSLTARYSQMWQTPRPSTDWGLSRSALTMHRNPKGSVASAGQRNWWGSEGDTYTTSPTPTFQM